MTNFRSTLILILALGLLLIFTGCAELLELLNQTQVQKPSASITDVKLSGLSFDKADLQFKISVDNPNNMAINLTGFNYDLFLNDNPFLNGVKNDPLTVDASNSSSFTLPVSLGYKKIYDTFKSLQNADSLQYKLDLDIGFELPVLGNTRIPVSTSGHLPTMKLPQVKLNALKLDNLGFTGAKMVLELAVSNPNSWSLDLNKLSYALKISGNEWLSGITPKSAKIRKNQNNIIQIPFSLNFLEVGRSVYNILNGNQKLDYSLSGAADLESSLPLVGKFNLPFQKDGKINILK